MSANNKIQHVELQLGAMHICTSTLIWSFICDGIKICLNDQNTCHTQTYTYYVAELLLLI